MRLTQKLLATKVKPLSGNENTDQKSYPEKTLGELLQHGKNGSEMARFGFVMLHGWTYNLNPWLNAYLVRIYGNEYREILACNELMARELASVPANAEVYLKPHKEDKNKIAAALKTFQTLRALATCDDTLFNDGIDIEIKEEAEHGINLLKGVNNG